MRIAAISSALVLIAVCGGAARAQSSAGAESFDFLSLDANARAVALGGAYTALAADSNALLYNPAGLAQMRRHEATVMHNQYAQGVSQQYIAAALRQGFGFQFNYLSVGSIPRTTISQPGGTGGRLNVSDTSLGAGYGRALSPDLSAGVGFKYINESLADASAKGYAIDLGALYRVRDLRGLTLGGSLLNLGPTVKFGTAKEKLPTTVRLGGAYAFVLPYNEAVVALDLTKSILDKVRLGVGAETVIDKAYAVRAGFTTRNDAGIGVTAGLGWKGESLGVDYAFAPLGELGTAHRISLTLRWGAMDDPTQAQAPEEGSPEARLRQAQVAMDAGQYTGARTYLITGLRQLPAGDRRRVRFQERLGSLALMRHDVNGALTALSEGLNIAIAAGYSDESVADTYIGIGMCLAAGKNYSDAVENLQKGISIGPSKASLEVAQAQLKALRAPPAAP